MKKKIKNTIINLGTFKMNVNTSCFGLELYKKNNYEPFSSDIVRFLLKPDSIFVDIGAYYGYYSLLAYQSQKNIKIIAFEPSKENFDILKKNLLLNKVKDFEIYNIAISNREGISQFNLTEASDCAGFYKHHLSETRKKINVQIIPGDKIIGNRLVDFIKIDVEGHEITVLEGLYETLKNENLILLIEFNPTLLEAAGHRPEELLEVIKNREFDIYFLDEFKKKYYKLINNEFWKQIERRKSYEGFCTNLLCIKKSNSLLFRYSEAIMELLSQTDKEINYKNESIKNLQDKLNILQNAINQRNETITALKSSKFYKIGYYYHNFRRFIKI